MGKLESKIQRDIIAYLVSVGAYVVRSVITSSNGTSDLHFCFRGRFCAFELKREGEIVKDESLQGYHLRKAKKAGALVGVARSVGDIKLLLDKLGEHID